MNKTTKSQRSIADIELVEDEVDETDDHDDDDGDSRIVEKDQFAVNITDWHSCLHEVLGQAVGDDYPWTVEDLKSLYLTLRKKIRKIGLDSSCMPDREIRLIAANGLKKLTQLLYLRDKGNCIFLEEVSDQEIKDLQGVNDSSKLSVLPGHNYDGRCLSIDEDSCPKDCEARYSNIHGRSALLFCLHRFRQIPPIASLINFDNKYGELEHHLQDCIESSSFEDEDKNVLASILIHNLGDNTDISKPNGKQKGAADSNKLKGLKKRVANTNKRNDKLNRAASLVSKLERVEDQVILQNKISLLRAAHPLYYKAFDVLNVRWVIFNPDSEESSDRALNTLIIRLSYFYQSPQKSLAYLKTITNFLKRGKQGALRYQGDWKPEWEYDPNGISPEQEAEHWEILKLEVGYLFKINKEKSWQQFFHRHARLAPKGIINQTLVFDSGDEIPLAEERNHKKIRSKTDDVLWLAVLAEILYPQEVERIRATVQKPSRMDDTLVITFSKDPEMYLDVIKEKVTQLCVKTIAPPLVLLPSSKSKRTKLPNPTGYTEPNPLETLNKAIEQTPDRDFEYWPELIKQMKAVIQNATNANRRFKDNGIGENYGFSGELLKHGYDPRQFLPNTYGDPYRRTVDFSPREILNSYIRYKLSLLRYFKILAIRKYLGDWVKASRLLLPRSDLLLPAYGAVPSDSPEESLDIRLHKFFKFKDPDIKKFLTEFMIQIENHDHEPLPEHISKWDMCKTALTEYKAKRDHALSPTIQVSKEAGHTQSP